MNGGDVIFHFKGDDKELKSKTSNIGKILGGIGIGVGTAFATGAAVAIGKIEDITKASVEAFAEYEQLAGGLESMFGKGSDEMNSILETSKQAYKDLTMSQNDYLTSFESAYPIITNGLSENADALEYTNKVLQLESDLFNTYGGSVDQYATAINWALKGTFSYVDNLNLGIKGTGEGFVEAANNAGILGREVQNVKDLTSDEIVDVIEYYAKQYGVLGKTAEEASKTIKGSLNMTKASWKDLISAFGKGEGIEEAFDNFINSAITFGDNLMPVVDRILNSLVSVIPKVVESIATYLPTLIQDLLPTLIQSTVNVLVSLTKALPSIIQVLADMLPIIIPEIINGALQVVIALAEALPDMIPAIVDAILGIIPALIDNLPLFLEAGGKLIEGLILGLINSIPSLLENGDKIMDSLLRIFLTLPGKFLEIGKNLIKGLYDGIVKKWDDLKKKVENFGNGIINKFKSVFGIKSPSREFYILGEYNMEGLENGMEDMQPEIQRTIDGMFDLSPNLTSSMNNTLSPNVVVNNYVTNETDPLGQVVTNIKTFSGGSKNDFNYGIGV
jgi:phage-related protein